MISHLRGRERYLLEPFGWTQEEAEWVALVCLHSGAFTRSQFCVHFDSSTKRAKRFVERLVERRFAVEETVLPATVGRATRICRITQKSIYRALDIPNVRHRRYADPAVLFRRLLSLDYVIDHLDLEWLPTEEEKVWYCEKLGIGRDLLPQRVYAGAVGGATRYFNLKLPIAGGPRTVFVYIDPGNNTDTELKSWGESHEALWTRLRTLGIRIHVAGIARGLDAEHRTQTALKWWARDIAGGVVDDSPQTREWRRELAEMSDGIESTNAAVLSRYGGFDQALQRFRELTAQPPDRTARRIRIDTYEAWRSDRISTLGAEATEAPQA